MSLRTIINEQSRQISRLEDIMSRFFSAGVSLRGDFPPRPPTTQLGAQAPDVPPGPDIEAQLAYNVKRFDAVIDQADYLSGRIYATIEGEGDSVASTVMKTDRY